MLGGGILVHAIYISMVATILPSAVAEVGGSEFYAWVSAFYGVGAVFGSAASFSLVSRVGPRRASQLGALLFLVGSAVCGAAPTMGLLVIGRGCQGVAGGLLAALAYALTAEVFQEHLRPRAIALISSVWGPVALAGPLVGGGLAELGSWRGAFWLAVPLTLAIAISARFTLPISLSGAGGRASGPRQIPTLRLALLASSAFAVAIGGVTGQLWAAALGVTAALLSIYLALRLDARADRKLFPAAVTDVKSPAGAICATMILMVVGTGATSFVTYLVAARYGANPLLGGYVAAAASISWTASELFNAGATGQRLKRVLTWCPSCMCIGMAGMALTLLYGSLPLTLLSWALFGAALGSWPHLTSLLVASVPSPDRAAAGTVAMLIQLLSTSIGAVFAGMLANMVGLFDATTSVEVAPRAFYLFAALTLPPAVAVYTSRRIPDCLIFRSGTTLA